MTIWKPTLAQMDTMMMPAIAYAGSPSQSGWKLPKVRISKNVLTRPSGFSSTIQMTAVAAMTTVMGMKKMVRKTTTPRSFWLTRMARKRAKNVCRGTTTTAKVMLFASAVQKRGFSKTRM